MSEIDWSVELRKIEREFDGLPPEPTPSGLRTQRELERQLRERREARLARIGVTARLTLVLALAVAILFWPYASCGPDFLAYLAAVAMVAVGGLWITVCTWRHRMARTHALALLVVLWGIALGAAQLLPRAGWAQGAQLHAPAWRCAGL